MTDSALAGDDWEHELNRPDGQPVLAVIFGGAVLALVSIVAPVPVFANSLVEQALILGVSIAAAAIVWGVAYAVTLRHCTPGWKIGALGLLWVVALLAAERSLVGTRQALATDLSTIDEIEDSPGGRLSTLQPNAERRGPITRTLLAYLREEDADKQKTEAAFVQTKLHFLAHPQQIALDGEILDHCDRAAEAKTLIGDYNARRTARGARFLASVDTFWVPDAVKATIRAFAERRNGMSQLEAAAKIDSAMLDALGARCAILARQNWKSWGYSFAFTSDPDLAAFNANVEQTLALVRQEAAPRSMVVRMFQLR